MTATGYSSPEYDLLALLVILQKARYNSKILERASNCMYISRKGPLLRTKSVCLSCARDLCLRSATSRSGTDNSHLHKMAHRGINEYTY